MVRLVRFTWQSVSLALTQIWANKGRSILTTIGIIIGVASVTAVIAALTGLKANVLSEFEAFGTNKIYVEPRRPETGPQRHINWWSLRFKPEQFEGMLTHCPAVSRYTPMASFGGAVQAGKESIESVQVHGISPAWHKIENRSVTMGRPFSLIDETQGWQVCLITPEVRDKLRLDRDPTGGSLVLNGRAFRIIGLVEPRVQSGMFGGGGGTAEVFIPFGAAWRLWRPFMYAVATSVSPEQSEEARAQITFFLRQTRQLKPEMPDNFRLHVIEQYLQQFNKMALAITMIAGGVVSISLLVGGVGIMNIMLVSVSERTREIGLRKAVGARPSAILFQFLVEAVMLCFLGGLLGLVVGQAITAGLASIPGAQLDKAYIPGWAVALSFGFAAGVGIFFGMFPAVKAARLDPIEALRHE